MTPGIYTDISIEAYHADKEYLSATSLKWARKSLAYFKWMREHEQPKKTAFDFGNAFELALLDRELFKSQVAVSADEMWIAEAMAKNPDYKTPRNSTIYQARKKEFEEEAFGRYKIMDVGNESYERIEAMLESCFKDAVIQRLIKNIEYQTSVYWVDDETGLKLKTRPDICKRKNNVIVNLKTAEDGSPSAFSKDLAKYDYPLQASIEISGCIASGLMPSVDNYFWLVVEKSPPFNATIYEYSQEDRRWGLDELSFVLNKVKRGMDENLFPGYSDKADNPHGILTAQIPMYYKSVF